MDESREESWLGDPEFGFAREACALAGRSSDGGATARAVVLVEAEDSTCLPRILGSAMIEATTTSPTAIGMT